MPNAPASTAAWTLERFLLELAERAYLADQTGTTAAVPTNDHDKDRLKRCFNLAYRSYCSSRPWTFLFQTVTLTMDPTGASAQCVDGDPSRYALPGGVLGPPANNWQYEDASSPYTEIVSADRGTSARRRQLMSGSSGVPTHAGHELEPSGQGPPASPTRWVATFTPAPSVAYVVSARFRVPVVDLSANSDVTIAGPDHDTAIFRAALYEWAKADMRLRPMLDVYKADADEARNAAVALDARNKPKRHGSPARTDSGFVPPVHEQGVIVTQYNGTTIPT